MKKKQYSQITLERYVLGELPASEREEVDESIVNDSAIQERLERIRKSNEEILTEYPAERTAREIELRIHSENTRETYDEKNSGRKRTLFTVIISAVGNSLSAVPAPIAIVTVLALVLVPTFYFYSDSESGTERIKGLDSKLTIYRNTPEGAVALAPRDSVSVGDVLQLGYIAAGQRYGVIFSIDGRGNHTLHFPASVDESTALEQDGEQLLDFAYELDDAPRFEHFFLVVSQSRINVTTILESVHSHLSQYGTTVEPDTLPVPEGCKVTSIVLRK